MIDCTFIFAPQSGSGDNPHDCQARLAAVLEREAETWMHRCARFQLHDSGSKGIA